MSNWKGPLWQGGLFALLYPRDSGYLFFSAAHTCGARLARRRCFYFFVLPPHGERNHPVPHAVFSLFNTENTQILLKKAMQRAGISEFAPGSRINRFTEKQVRRNTGS
ncbi:MAG: hypothetical protein HFE39_07445 [Clostridiales bacterium]|nr:hypothetical protein [Clostridiales bacterium]